MCWWWYFKNFYTCPQPSSGRRNHSIVYTNHFLLSQGSIFAKTKFWLFSLNGSSSKWMVTVCVGGGRRTICNGLPLPTKCTMIKLFLFFSFGYFGIFQDFWCLSLDMSTKCTMIDFPFFFFLAVFVICWNFGVYHQIYGIIFLSFISRQAYSGFILLSLLFSVIVPVNQAPINILSFPPLVSLLTKQTSSHFFFLFLFFYHSGQSTTHLFPPLSSYKIISSPCKKPFS